MASQALAGECPSSWDADTCYDHLQRRAIDAGIRSGSSKAQRSPETRDEQLAQVLGGSELGLLSTSLVNLLPGVSGLIWGGDVSRGQVPNAALAINTRALGLSSTGTDTVLQPAVVADPAVLPPLRRALEQAGASETLRRLEESLQPTDAGDVGLTIALVDEAFGFQFGRRAQRFHNLYGVLVDGLRQQSMSAQPGDGNLNLNDVVQRAVDSGDCGETRPRDIVNVAFSMLDTVDSVGERASDCESALRAELRDTANRIQTFYEHLQIEFEQAQLNQYLDLIANNAQLMLTVRYADVESVIEASSIAGRVTLELAWGPSIGGFLRDNQDVCAENVQAATCYKQYTDWLQEEKVTETSGHEHRVSLFVEGARLDEIDVSVSIEDDMSPASDGGLPGLPGPAPGMPQSVEVFLPATTRVHAGARWGYTLFRPPPDRGGVALRMEAGGDYFWFESAALRNRRWRAHAGLTLQVFGLSFPFQVIYESDPEFDAQERLDDVRVLSGLRVNFR